MIMLCLEWRALKKMMFKVGNINGPKSLDLQSKEDNIEKWNYRTIWIGSYNRDR